jgi:hypothetical protein
MIPVSELLLIVGGVFALLCIIALAVRMYYRVMLAHYDPIIRYYYERDTKRHD